MILSKFAFSPAIWYAEFRSSYFKKPSLFKLITTIYTRSANFSISFPCPLFIGWNLSSFSKHNAICLLLPPYFLSSLSFVAWYVVAKCPRFSITLKCFPTNTLTELKQLVLSWCWCFVYTRYESIFSSFIIMFATIECWNGYSLRLTLRIFLDLIISCMEFVAFRSFLFLNKAF